MDELMHIDKYKIFSMDYTWKNQKKSKTTAVTQYLTSDECIQGKDFVSLLDSLDDVWHKHEGKTCKIEVTFEPYEEE
jgi:hypothetical protein|tara:strand:+ start:458 stop:688 length:231 start_codon:yes stop_codon:yes gene_type:complete